MGGARNTHLVCTGCRVSVKQPMRRLWLRPRPRCKTAMRDATTNLEAPRRADTGGWRALTAVLDTGLDLHFACERCQDGPGPRPRTAAEIRRRLTRDGRTRITPAQALGQREAGR